MNGGEDAKPRANREQGADADVQMQAARHGRWTITDKRATMQEDERRPKRDSFGLMMEGRV